MLLSLVTGALLGRHCDHGAAASFDATAAAMALWFVALAVVSFSGLIVEGIAVRSMLSLSQEYVKADRFRRRPLPRAGDADTVGAELGALYAPPRVGRFASRALHRAVPLRADSAGIVGLWPGHGCAADRRGRDSAVGHRTVMQMFMPMGLSQLARAMADGESSGASSRPEEPLTKPRSRLMKLQACIRWSAIAISVALVVAVLVAYFTSGNTCDAPNTAAPGNPMKAIVYCDYGTADVLKLEDIEKPTPEDNQILVRVRAAAVNPLDWHYMRGTPYIMRMGTGLRKPKDTRLGVDFAGTVEAVGRNVTQFKPGDDVFGGRTGAFAEYVSARADRAVALKPANLTFEQAAAVPVAAITALQGLRDKGKIQPGQKVLINGASGGVGTFAVQIAKSFGADVTGVCSTRNVELVRSLGADHVIDYTKEDFTQSDQRYDVILDNVGNRSLPDNRRVLNPDGNTVLIGGGGPDDGRWIGPMINPIKGARAVTVREPGHGHDAGGPEQGGPDFLSDLMQAGKVTPVIDRRYSLSEVPEAIRYLEDRARSRKSSNPLE